MEKRIGSRRTEGISSFIVMDVLEKACEMECQGQNVIHLEVGEPDFDTPDCVKAALCQAVNEGFTHYTHSLGLPELREAICDYYLKTYGVTVSPGRVLITSGTSPAMFLLFATLLDPGDEVIISDPHYACYPTFIKFAEATPVYVPVTEAEGFQYRPDDIAPRLGPRTKGILINSPLQSHRQSVGSGADSGHCRPGRPQRQNWLRGHGHIRRNLPWADLCRTGPLNLGVH